MFLGSILLLLNSFNSNISILSVCFPESDIDEVADLTYLVLNKNRYDSFKSVITCTPTWRKIDQQNVSLEYHDGDFFTFAISARATNSFYVSGIADTSSL